MWGQLFKLANSNNGIVRRSRQLFKPGCYCLRSQCRRRLLSTFQLLRYADQKSEITAGIESTNERECVYITFVVAGPDVPVGGEWAAVTEKTPRFTIPCEIGRKLLLVIQENIPLNRFGVCQGNLTCATCRLVFKPKDYAILPAQLDKELRVNLTCSRPRPSSRLGCQLRVSYEMDGMEMLIPRPLKEESA